VKRRKAKYFPQVENVLKSGSGFVAGALALLLSSTSMTSTAQTGRTDTGRTDLYGNPVPPSSGARTIVINPDTRHVNVEGGEVINFRVGDKIFSWSFFVAQSVHTFDLNQIAPPGLLDHKVSVYVSPDPRYWGMGE